MDTYRVAVSFEFVLDAEDRKHARALGWTRFIENRQNLTLAEAEVSADLLKDMIPW